MNEIHHIYDKAFKRVLTLSEKTVINLINGLFDTDYPTNSNITYNWTEHEDKGRRGGGYDICRRACPRISCDEYVFDVLERLGRRVQHSLWLGCDTDALKA